MPKKNLVAIFLIVFRPIKSWEFSMLKCVSLKSSTRFDCVLGLNCVVKLFHFFLVITRKKNEIKQEL